MLIYLTLSIILIQFNYSFGQFNCPSSFGLFADPARCTNYYECEGFTANSKQCGNGLFFNSDMKICDWPSNVDQTKCSANSGGEDENLSNQNSNIQNSHHISFQCYADGLYEDPVSCRHFIECSGLIPYRKICPAELHYDARIKACNWPQSRVCSKHTRPLITQRPKSTSRPTTFTYATPSDSNMNFKPDRQTISPSRQTTTTLKPPTSSLDPFNENCEWCFKCPNKNDNYYENKYDKYTYYHCFRGQSYLLYCPRDAIWVQSKQKCQSENEDKLNESFKDENTGDDGAGLIDSRMKNRKQTTTTTKKPTTKKNKNTKPTSTTIKLKQNNQPILFTDRPAATTKKATNQLSTTTKSPLSSTTKKK